ncbi:hypothetical protein GGX14DRAFT_393480 [Mycena pura]|uniref:Uncharacterized protein n=1 Tax=Mycena pura TaxID=153505 RepID=A0AAD6VGY6_9AGAR|nr:hypothetical protein GGX14DRAFT_393480 [Mycena pura]
MDSRVGVDIRSREDVQLDVMQDRLELGVKRPCTSASNNTGTGALTGTNASLGTPPTPRAHSRASIDSTISDLHHRRTRARSLAKAPPPPPAQGRRPPPNPSSPLRTVGTVHLTSVRAPRMREELLNDANFLYAGGAAHAYLARGSASPYSLALADILAFLQELLRSALPITGRATQQHFPLRASATRTGAISIRARPSTFRMTRRRTNNEEQQAAAGGGGGYASKYLLPLVTLFKSGVIWWRPLAAELAPEIVTGIELESEPSSGASSVLADLSIAVVLLRVGTKSGLGATTSLGQFSPHVQCGSLCGRACYCAECNGGAPTHRHSAAAASLGRATGRFLHICDEGVRAQAHPRVHTSAGQRWCAVVSGGAATPWDDATVRTRQQAHAAIIRSS